MEHKGYEVIARASRLPAGHYRAQFAVYKTSPADLLEIVHQGVIASLEYRTAAAAEADAKRMAKAWIDTRARTPAPRGELCAGAGSRTAESRPPVGLVWD
jgi:hypothetical protein